MHMWVTTLVSLIMIPIDLKITNFSLYLFVCFFNNPCAYCFVTLQASSLLVKPRGENNSQWSAKN